MKRLHHVLCLLVGLLSLGILALGLASFHSPAPRLSFTYTVLSGSPLRLSFHLAPLGGVFLCLLGIVGSLASLYAVGYGSQYRSRRHGVWLDAGLFAFVAAMALVLVSANVLTFMMAWELMSIASYLLVVFDHERQDTVRAGLLYIAMTQLGSAFLLIAFLLMHAWTGSYAFAAFARTAHTLPPAGQSAIMLFALMGLFLKAGIMPLHIWLPRAHPVAPSHVSGLLSGVMIKLALYVLLLFGWAWFHADQAWWGELITAFGIASAVPGAWLASQETRLKRILAFSSIDNMGLLVMCVGVAMTSAALHERTLAGAALVAALFQASSHALFKSTLFQGAGTVLHSAHTDNLNQLGGLLRRMPTTGTSVLAALLSYAALPPSGGFIGEWLLFSALGRTAARELHSFAGALTLCALLALFLTTAFSALSALRIFGVAFLADPRSENAASAHEGPLSMRIAMGLGAVFTLALGIFAATALHFIGQALPAGLWRMPATPGPWAGGMTVAAVLVPGTVLAWGLPRIVSGRQRARTAPTWTCGGQRVASMSYSATGLSQPAARTFTRGAHMAPLALRYLYRPAWAAVARLANIIRQIQSGHLRSYLVYLFATALVLLLLAR